MKKLKYLYVLLFVFVFLPLLTTKVKAFSGNGTGSDTDPYQITNCSQLQDIVGDPSKVYELENSIDCSATSTWNYDSDTDSYYGFVPVGSGGNLFTGVLDGKGYTISGLYVNKHEYFNGGLFGATSGDAKVKNLNIDSATIIAIGRAGVVAGVGTLNIDNVHVTNSTVTGNDMDKEEIGGLIGYSYSSVISNSSFSGSVSGKLRVGGLVGYEEENLTITNSSNSGNVTGFIRVGGLVGSAENSVTISESNNSGAITSNGTYDTQYQGVGGLVGVAWKADITKSYNTGSITTGAGGFYIGGILGGGGKATISSSYNTGAITSGATSYILMA